MDKENRQYSQMKSDIEKVLCRFVRAITAGAPQHASTIENV